jgi:DNA-binding transcriptional LysR family regulator
MQREVGGLDAIALLAAAVEAGSLSSAARALGLSKATLSRTLAALEQELGATLVERRSSGLVATAVGRALLDRATPALAELHRARDEVRRSTQAPAGHVRLSCPPELAHVWVGPLVRSYVARHADAQVEIHYTSRVVDLARDGFDLVVRGGRVDDPTLRMRLLGSMHTVLVASPTYLARRRIERVEELARESCLTLAVDRTRTWELVDPSGRVHRVVVSGRFATDDLVSLRDAAVEGLGIARLPAPLCEAALARQELVRVLERFEVPSRPYYVVSPAGRLPARVRALVEHLTRGASRDSAGAAPRMRPTPSGRRASPSGSGSRAG